MRRRRHITATAGSLLVGTLLLAGCSAPSTEAGDDGEVTIEMSWWGDDNRAALFAEVIDKFEAENPDITVKQTPVGAPDLGPTVPNVAGLLSAADAALYRAKHAGKTGVRTAAESADASMLLNER